MHNDEVTKQRMKAELLMEQLEAAGFSPEDLVALRDGGELPGHVTLAEYLPTVTAAATDSSTHVYAPYWGMLAEGLPGICACACPRCLGAFGKVVTVDKKVRPSPCPCVTGGCDCPTKFFKREGQSCDDRYAGLGDTELRSVTKADIATAMAWSERKAVKHWAYRNIRRAQNGRTLHTHDGSHAKEHLRQAASAIFGQAQDDPSTGVRSNVALKTDAPRRQKTLSRAWTIGELQQIWEALFTTGSQDVELDMLIVWFHLETGARRGGALTLVLDALDWTGQTARLTEKGGTVNNQPVSRGLIGALIAHALERGDVVAKTVGGLRPEDVTADDVLERRATLRGDQPVFYYKNRWMPKGKIEREPHPLTRRRYNSLFDRLQRALPWADRIGARTHDMRKTGAVFVERACGYAVARNWLRHSGGDPTNTYVVASAEEVAEGFELLTGQSHPLAEEKRRREQGGMDQGRGAGRGKL